MRLRCQRAIPMLPLYRDGDDHRGVAHRAGAPRRPRGGRTREGEVLVKDPRTGRPREDGGAALAQCPPKHAAHRIDDVSRNVEGIAAGIDLGRAR